MTKEELYSYRAIFFDIDGTLYPIKYLNRQFRKLYFRHPIKTINFFKARKRVRVLQKESKESCITRDEFLSIQCKSINKDKTYLDVLYKNIRKNRRLVPYDGLYGLLAELKKRGVLLGVLSDFPVETKLKELGLDKFFSVVLSTEDCGFLKPNKRAFDYLLSNIPFGASECLYVGDSVTKDIEGAKNSHISSLLIDDLLSIIKK